MTITGHNRLKAFSRICLAGAVLAGCAVLTACGSVPTDRTTTGGIGQDYNQTHPITLAEVEHTVDIPVASGDHGLTLGVRDAVRGFASDYVAISKGTLQIQVPYGAMNSGAASRVTKEVRNLLIDSGVRSTLIVQSSYDAGSPDQSAPLRLSFVAVTAVTDQCGNWPKDLMSNSFSNKNWDNFGCATQQNLAAQIANPMDIVAPRGMTPIDAARRSAVLAVYRKGS